MSRRSQSRRRRTYGRRQHEVRERRPSQEPGLALSSNDVEPRDGWLSADGGSEQRGFEHEYFEHEYEDFAR